MHSTGLSLLLLAAAPFADLDAIDRALSDFTQGAAAPVDRRLRLNPCTAPPSLSWRTDAQDSVLVQCNDAGGWRLFVPLRQGASGPMAVSRGDAVSIAISGEGFTVAQPGEAMDSGAVGAWIRVRPVGARPGDEPMRVQIVRPGLVTLPLP